MANLEIILSYSIIAALILFFKLRRLGNCPVRAFEEWLVDFFLLG